nr:hypothetical protein [Tanacetum cinerariifolium]
MKSIQTFLKKLNCIPFGEKPKILLQAWDKKFSIQHAQPEDSNELFHKLLEDLQIINKELIKCNHLTFFDDDKDHSVQYKEYLENSSNEIVASNSNQKKENPPQDFDIRQLIREECCIEVCEEQKQNMKNTMLELVEICSQKELYCMHDNIYDLIESALNSKLLSINLNSQRLDKKKQEVKNVVEQPAERRTRIVKSLQNFRIIHKSSISLNNTSQISPIHAVAPILSTKEPEYSLSMGYENSCVYDPNPNYFDYSPDYYHPPHPTYETYWCDSYGNDSHFGYDCQPQFLLNYESEPGYIENYNSYPYDSSSFQQQELCCEDCRDLSESDHCQPPQYTVNHPIFNAHNDLLNANNDLLNSQNKITIAQNKLMEQLTSMCAVIPACCDDDDDDSAITPNDPVYSLSIGDEHLNTIWAMESDEFIKSSVENLVPNPSESEGENGCDVPASFTTFSNVLFDVDYEFDSVDDQSLSDEDISEKIFSNPLFNEEIIPMKIDQHQFNAESDLIESLRIHDSSIIPSSKIDSFLDEFADELTHLQSIPPGIDKTDCYPEEDIRLIERLLYDNSSPRPPEEFVSENSKADIESFSPSPIPVEDSDSRMEEINSFLTPDNPMPPSIEDDDDDSERDILIYGNTGILNIKMMGDDSEQKVPIPGLMITLVSNQEKSPDLLSHRSLENFLLFAKYPMMIHEKNIPILDVPLFHFYPIDQFKYEGNWVKLNDLKQALRGRHPMPISSLVFLFSS